MDLQLADKQALVTGSTSGIGYAIAAALLREGADVVVNGRSQATVDAAIASLTEATGRAPKGFAADMSTAEGTSAIHAAFPNVDILVNNVGGYGPQAFEQSTDEDWYRLIDLNVMSGVRLIAPSNQPRESAEQRPHLAVHGVDARLVASLRCAPSSAPSVPTRANDASKRGRRAWLWRRARGLADLVDRCSVDTVVRAAQRARHALPPGRRFGLQQEVRDTAPIRSRRDHPSGARRRGLAASSVVSMVRRLRGRGVAGTLLAYAIGVDGGGADSAIDDTDPRTVERGPHGRSSFQGG